MSSSDISSDISCDFDVFITDLNGNARGKRLPAHALKKMDTEGMKLPMSSVAEDIWGNDTPGSGLVFETGDSDGICKPIDGTLLPVPWGKHERYLLMATMTQPDGSPFLCEPRQLLGSVVQKLKDAGITAVAATELEFYLMDADSVARQRPQPPVVNGKRMKDTEGYAIDELDGLEDFFADIRKTCETLDVPADTIISEIGPGQYEINLNHINDPLKAADHAILFKRLVKGTATKHGMAASFMAKPYMGESGNGFHVHFSMVDDQGNNIFDDGTDKGTDTLRHAIGGLMKAMPESMLVFAPHLNSYRRFQKGAHAPTFASWGYENRTVALRVPESPGVARRIEHRVSGADANPYLVLATILAGALHGISEKIEPNQAVEGDAYEAYDPNFALPNTWEMATTALENSDLLKEILGEQFVRVFSAIKRQEQDTINAQISDVEYESYVGIL